MNTLFGKSEIDKLRDLDYKTESHTFSKGVIAAYYNGLEYPLEVTSNYVKVKRRKESVFFILTTGFSTEDYDNIYYIENKHHWTRKKIKEVIYDLDKIFTNPSKNVRRGIDLINRNEIIITTGAKGDEITKLYNEWSEHKMNDPKVFRIAFTPKRYLRSFQLYDKGFNIVELAYYIKGELYATICYEVQDNIAFELAFISRYWRKDLKFINDLNECILIDSFNFLYRKGIKRINVGPTAGIKGLKVFKNKLPHEEICIYSN